MYSFQFAANRGDRLYDVPTQAFFHIYFLILAAGGLFTWMMYFFYLFVNSWSLQVRSRQCCHTKESKNNSRVSM